MCADGQPVGKLGAATVFDLDEKLLRDWEQQEDELKSSLKGDGSYHTAAGYSLSSGKKVHNGGLFRYLFNFCATTPGTTTNITKTTNN